jgi:hypothetical protein
MKNKKEKTSDTQLKRNKVSYQEAGQWKTLEG